MQAVVVAGLGVEIPGLPDKTCSCPPTRAWPDKRWGAAAKAASTRRGASRTAAAPRRIRRPPRCRCPAAPARARLSIWRQPHRLARLLAGQVGGHHKQRLAVNCTSSAASSGSSCRMGPQLLSPGMSTAVITARTPARRALASRSSAQAAGARRTGQWRRGRPASGRSSSVGGAAACSAALSCGRLAYRLAGVSAHLSSLQTGHRPGIQRGAVGGPAVQPEAPSAVSGGDMAAVGGGGAGVAAAENHPSSAA